MQKKCFKCGETKEITAFYKHPQMGDGHLNKCKVCTKHDVRDNYLVRHDQYVAYERKRRPKKERIYQTKEETAAKRRDWARRSRSEYPEKWSARQKLKRAVDKGLVKKMPCEVCGSDNSQAHHDDYNRPLDVAWLCPKHHAEVTAATVRADRTLVS